MAKKKTNTQSQKNTKNQHQTPTHDAVSEQLHSLKSLNSMLLKETVDRRQQVDCLSQANKFLESELIRSVSEYASLRSELNRLSERLLALEIEKGVASSVFSVKILELEEVNRSERVEMAERNSCLERRLKQVLKEKSTLDGEIAEGKFILSRVSEERDAIRAQMEDRIRNENGLRLKLAEAEKKEAAGLEELRKLRADYDGLVKEKASVERKMGSVFREKDSIGRSLVESNGVVNDLRRDINKITKEKMVIEDDRDLQVKKKNQLQMSIDGLNELVNKLQQRKSFWTTVSSAAAILAAVSFAFVARGGKAS